MLDDMPISNLCRTDARWTWCLVLSAVLTFTACGTTYAQGEAKTNAPGSEVGTPSSSSPEDKSNDKAAMRARRAGESPVVTVAASNSDAPAGEDIEVSMFRGEIKEAKTDAERARLQRQLVDRLIEINRQNEAVTELLGMAREERFDPTNYYNIGNALARLGQSGAAVEAYRKAIKQRHGNYARALNNLGVVLIRLGRWDEAYESLTAALTQENYTYAEASYNLGRLYTLRGEAGLAIREWTRTLHLQPGHADAAIALARAYTEEGNTERALAVLDAFVARSSRKGINVPGSIASTRREIIEASATEQTRKNDERAVPPASTLRTHTVNQQTYNLLQSARAAREQGQYEEAVKTYREVIARSGGYFPPANLELSYALINLRRNTEAIESLLQVTAKDGPRYPVAYYHLGRLYEHLGQLDRAAENFNRAAALFIDTNPEALLDISRVREKQGDMPGALAAMETYIKASARLGNNTDWTTERLIQLRRKVVTTSAAQSPAPKP